MTATPEPRHGFKLVNGRATGPLCGAEFFEGYASSLRENVRCSACLALLEPIPTPEPFPVIAPVTKKRAKAESIQGQLL